VRGCSKKNLFLLLPDDFKVRAVFLRPRDTGQRPVIKTSIVCHRGLNLKFNLVIGTLNSTNPEVLLIGGGTGTDHVSSHIVDIDRANKLLSCGTVRKGAYGTVTLASACLPHAFW